MRIRRALLWAALVAGCGGAAGRFPPREPMWADRDRDPFAPRPAKYEAPEVWDTVDNSFFRPVARLFAVHVSSPAVDVNALDEVPDSSWFENRLSRRRLSREELIAGSCDSSPPDVAGPWRVIGGKPNGVNPGFLIQDAEGRRHLLKLDGTEQGERSTAADTIGALVYHATGYFVPCNRIVFFDPRILRLAAGVTAEDFVGDQVPFTAKMLNDALAKGVRLPDGRLRASVSQLLAGKPLGPWADTGTRPDDPNDAIPHEDRRELRGSYVLAAWLGRYDSREQNALDMWIETAGGLGWVKHHFIDFSDCLGSMKGEARIDRRRGLAYEFDWSVLFGELATFGLRPRPWHDAALGPTGKVLGYFDVEHFRPDRWRTAYPYGPFQAVTEADAAWAARMIARLGPDEIEAIVDEAQIHDEVVRRETIRILLGRREKLLRRYLGRLSPLTDPRVFVSHDGSAPRLCVRDAWVEGGLGAPASRTITARVEGDGGGSLAVAWSPELDPAEVCATLPVAAGATSASPRYLVVEWRSPPQGALRVHLYARSPTDFQVVGLER